MQQQLVTLAVLCSLLCLSLAVPSKAPAKNATEGGEGEEPSFPYRDLPADVLRDFPGLCFGSTALRLFHVGQSWSLAPFCGVASCLVTEDGEQLVERVQDCGPQPKKNPKCSNINNATAMEAVFPDCCPEYKCEEGVALEYHTPEELLKMAQEAAEAVVKGQYDGEEGTEEGARSAREISLEKDFVDVVSKEAEDEKTPAA